MKTEKKTGAKRGSYSIREGRLLLGSRPLGVPPLLVILCIASCDRDPFRDRAWLPAPVVDRILRIATYIQGTIASGRTHILALEGGGHHA
jgi:hypothetical protein